MSSNGDSVFPSQKPRLSGAKAALQYTGIPPSWLDKRPRLPSRNWLIFLGVTSTLTGYYIFDRRECKRIRQEYVDKVKERSEEPMGSMELPRKVTVYGAKWPGDEDYDRNLKYFRKYVKPILVAAAIDYDTISGKRHGDLARRVEDTIRSQRRVALGLDPPPLAVMPLPGSSPEEKRQREVEGGIVIVGRNTLKEFMAGLKRGWTEPLDVRDREEQLAHALNADDKFDEPPEPELLTDAGADEPIPTQSRLAPSSPLSVLATQNLRKSPPASRAPERVDPAATTPPTQLPPQPPMLLVSFTNNIGFTQIPHMIWDFFNQRRKVREGGEAALKLIDGHNRPFAAPPPAPLSEFTPEPFLGTEIEDPQKSNLADLSSTDLDFDRKAESYYKKSVVRNFASEIQKARNEYYAALPKKLETARALARGTREPTKDEKTQPPPTEVELRTERFKKELRWTSDEEGWAIVRPEANVVWDERFREVLRIYT